MTRSIFILLLGLGLGVVGVKADAQAAPRILEAVVPEEIPEENLAQARQSEAQLNQDQRAAIQRKLQEGGFYPGIIDASFGPGTRAGMRGWQTANGYQPTGVLTAKQRAELLGQVSADLEDLELRTVQDDASGIKITVPTATVAFDKREAPFTFFEGTGQVEGARMLLISQPGDRNKLIALYDIMQTLEIVPEVGERAIEGDGFTLRGANSRFSSHTQAWLRTGEIKGFTLIWPTGDEDRRRALLTELQGSFERVPGVLDPAVGDAEEQRVDLVSGLEIRRPKKSLSGFFVDRSGTVVTSLDAVQGCERVTIDEDYTANVVAIDDALGVAVLRPASPLAPTSVAEFQMVSPRLQSEIAVAGFSYGGVLGSPTLTFGQLSDLVGLNGEEDVKRLALAPLEGDTGGPVVDGFGAVVGMLLPGSADGRKLPEGVSFAANTEALTAVLQQAGVAPQASSASIPVPPETLAKKATGITVLVGCWD
ncbi:MAG: serine protease [Pseudomonadota bacterium]